MKFIALLLALVSFSAFACWKVEGTLGVDGETFKFNQKFDHGKEYSFPMGTFILNLTLNTGKGKKHTVRYAVFEKKGVKLNLVTKGDDDVTENTKKEILAKGEENQPNTILTLNLKHI
jgi:hypothetical protein